MDAANYPARRAVVAGSQIKPSRSRGQAEAMRLIVGKARTPHSDAPPRGGLPAPKGESLRLMVNLRY
jgi:hypothetical protein